MQKNIFWGLASYAHIVWCGACGGNIMFWGLREVSCLIGWEGGFLIFYSFFFFFLISGNHGLIWCFMDLFGVLEICGCGYGCSWVPVEHISLTISGFLELSPLRAFSHKLPSPELGNRWPFLVIVTGRFQNPNSILIFFFFLISGNHGFIWCFWDLWYVNVSGYVCQLSLIINTYLLGLEALQILLC